eukprot:gene1140-biopygen11186
MNRSGVGIQSIWSVASVASRRQGGAYASQPHGCHRRHSPAAALCSQPAASGEGVARPADRAAALPPLRRRADVLPALAAVQPPRHRAAGGHAVSLPPVAASRRSGAPPCGNPLPRLRRLCASMQRDSDLTALRWSACAATPPAVPQCRQFMLPSAQRCRRPGKLSRRAARPPTGCAVPPVPALLPIPLPERVTAKRAEPSRSSFFALSSFGMPHYPVVLRRSEGGGERGMAWKEWLLPQPSPSPTLLLQMGAKRAERLTDDRAVTHALRATA